MVKNLAQTVGRRKTAIARVYIRQGKGEITVNERPLTDYFKSGILQFIVNQPLDVTDNLNKYDIVITVRGGGLSGQAEAIRHGIARALVAEDEANQKALKANGFLTRDPRMVERKKYGRPGARKKFQFSKR